jgi:hypothetical protein
MRAAPSLQCTIVRRGGWRSMVVAGVALAAATAMVWIAQRLQAELLINLCATAGASLAAGFATLRALRLPPVRLQFDGRGWWLGRTAQADDAAPGRLSVVIDLGRWMLLRFEHDTVSKRSREVVWLPVGAHGLGRQWHALRCAACAGGEVAASKPAVDA